MNTKILTVGILAAIAGLIGGFLVANSLNRTEINLLKGQVEQKKTATSDSKPAPNEFTIDDDEIKAKIAQADGSPDNFGFQKNLGSALYRYATMKKDAALVDEAKRILIRANTLDPKDYDVLVDLGNAYFDTGYFKKDAASFNLARETYERAFQAKPADADVRTDFALTFFLDDPPDLAKAVAEFQKAIQFNPKQERALQYLTATYMRQGNFADAEKAVLQLKAANPKNDAIADLETQIAKKEAPSVK